MNNPKLKLAMARLLPHEIHTGEYDGTHYFQWKLGRHRSEHYTALTGTSTPILETEWLYVMHLVEQTLDTGKKQTYRKELYQVLRKDKLEGYGKICHATFNQRAEAMCKVKGIEIEN